MFLCLNCGVFGDPRVSHRWNCPDRILVEFDPKQVGWYFHDCGHVEKFHAGPPPSHCPVAGCTVETVYVDQVYEYPKELRRS